MKVALAAVAVTALAVAAPLSAAHASTGVSIRVDTPEFGIRIGTPVRTYAPVPVYAPAPAYLPPVYGPAPAYVPPRIIYAPPRVVVSAPVIYPFVHRHPHRYVAPYQYKKFRRDDRDDDHRYRRDRHRIGN